jgi:hypothetical protein
VFRDEESGRGELVQPACEKKAGPGNARSQVQPARARVKSSVLSVIAVLPAMQATLDDWEDCNVLDRSLESRFKWHEIASSEGGLF